MTESKRFETFEAFGYFSKCIRFKWLQNKWRFLTCFQKHSHPHKTTLASAAKLDLVFSFTPYHQYLLSLAVPTPLFFLKMMMVVPLLLIHWKGTWGFPPLTTIDHRRWSYGKGEEQEMVFTHSHPQIKLCTFKCAHMDVHTQFPGVWRLCSVWFRVTAEGLVGPRPRGGGLRLWSFFLCSRDICLSKCSGLLK